MSELGKIIRDRIVIVPRVGATASIQIVVKTGSVHEEGYVDGISHFLEHMIFKGTTNMSMDEINDFIDYTGANINAYTGYRKTVYTLDMFNPEFITTSVGILCDMVVNPLLDPELIEKEIGVIKEEINMNYDNIDRYAYRQFIQKMFEGTNYQKPVLGTTVSVESTDKAALERYHTDKYTLSNTTIILICDPRYVTDSLNIIIEKFKDMPIGEPNMEYPIALNPGTYVESRGNTQAHIYIGVEGKIGMDVDNTLETLYIMFGYILGSGMSSRLFKTIRIENSLAYSVYGRNMSYGNQSVLIVSAATELSNVEQATPMLHQLISDMKNGITYEEYEKAKNMMITDFVCMTERATDIGDVIVEQVSSIGKTMTTDECINTVKAVSYEQLNAFVVNTINVDKRFTYICE